MVAYNKNDKRLKQKKAEPLTRYWQKNGRSAKFNIWNSNELMY